MARRISIGGIWSFGLIWFGQLISLIGSGLSGFVLGVWVFQQTGSATLFALSAVFSSLPNILLLPFAGALADRWDKRRTMIYCNLAASLCTLVVALLFFTGQLRVWHVYIAITLISISSTFMGLVYSTVITRLVSKEHFGRSSGLSYTAQAASQVLPPLLAGLLIAGIRIPGIILIDFVSYLFAVGTLLLVHIPGPETSRAGPPPPKQPLRREAAAGWNYVKERPGLLALMFYFAIINFVVGLARVLFYPMILGFTSPRELGTILSVGGLGFLAGGAVMSVWGGPQNRIRGVLIFGWLCGCGVILSGLRPSVPLIAAGAFCLYFFIPLVNGCSQAIWLSKTPADVQGRVFAIRMMVSLSTSPVAYLLAGPLADGVFGPLVAGSESLQRFVGAGAGRGIGLMFVTAGALTILIQLIGYLYPRLRQVEVEIPDAVDEGAVSGA